VLSTGRCRAATRRKRLGCAKEGTAPLPAREPYLVGIDMGTQSTSVCVFSASGRAVARATSPQKVTSLRAGWAEQDPAEWWGSLRRALRKATKGINTRRIAGAGIAFQRETFTLADGRGRFLRPAILWLDVRAGVEVDEIARDIGRGSYHKRTGKPLDITSALARLVWLARHEPGCIEKAARWVDVGSAAAHALTGVRATCVAGADTCGLVGLGSRDWIEPYLDYAGMRPEQFPGLVEPGSVIGRVTKDAARATGLPEGLPVVAAGGDGQVFNVGMNAAAPWGMSLTLGTSIVLGVACPETPVSPLFRTLIAASGGHLLECVLQSGTYLLRWFVETYGPGRGRDESYWDGEIRDIPPGAEGLVTVPNWWGVRFPDYEPSARGATVGWSNHHTLAHFYRSLVEGLSFELRRTVAELEGMFPGKLSGEVRAGGGGAKSRVWPQILADVLGRRISLAKETEATALGAAILAGVGVGIFRDAKAGGKRMVTLAPALRPDGGRRRIYRSLFEEVYRPLAAAATPVSKALKRLTDEA